MRRLECEMEETLVLRREDLPNSLFLTMKSLQKGIRLLHTKCREGSHGCGHL